MAEFGAAEFVFLEVHGVGAPSQVLQGLQEGLPGLLLLSGGQAFLFHLLDLIEGDRLGLKAVLTGSSQLAFAP